MRIPIFFFISLLLPATLQAQVPTTAATAFPRRILVGDPVTVTFSVRNVPAGGRIAWPVIPDSFGALQVLERGKIDTGRGPGGRSFTQKVIISGYDSVIASVPPLTFNYSDASGLYPLTTPEIPVVVQTVQVDTTKPPRPPKDILPVEKPFEIPWLLIGIALAALALITALVIYLRRRGKRKPAPAHIRMGAAQKALHELDLLRAEELPQKGLHEAYFTRLTGVLRTYIKVAHRIPATEMTTPQIIGHAADSEILRNYGKDLEEVLLLADPAKFGKAAPSAGESEEAMAAARRFITATTELGAAFRRQAAQPDGAAGRADESRPPSSSRLSADEQAEREAYFRETGKTYEEATQEAAIHAATENAERVVKGFGDKYVLDYSEESLAVLDALIEEVARFGGKMDKEMKSDFFAQAGSYIFEVARRKYGGKYYHYAHMQQVILVTGEPEFSISLLAIEKVKQRFEHGKDDNIPYFYKGYAERVKEAKPGDNVMIT